MLSFDTEKEEFSEKSRNVPVYPYTELVAEEQNP